ncbi:hypothetical protein [Halospina sp. K52047b]|uniref:hypothetical protein n=1 Tax=Halospina sp. K52047b TaxID=2614160 RepID=UPI00124A7DDD|nr:hypothetical protein [Halospina sp. K52047b]KAA8977833.1 hypothetical protein F3089_14745 [Halospina sp. K52047b]
MEWDLKELKDKVLHVHGKPAYSNLSPCLNSIFERQEFARYHYHEAKTFMEGYMDDSYPDMELVRLVFSGSGSHREQLEDNKFRARAHIVGCVQSLHSISDILGHVVYYSLNLSQASTERDISLLKVRKWVGANRQYKRITDGLDELISHQGYQYLVALANYSKHRSIISLNFNFNLRPSTTAMRELVFPSFTYDGTFFPATSVYQFLESEFSRESKLVFEIGNEINRLLV